MLKIIMIDTCKNYYVINLHKNLCDLKEFCDSYLERKKNYFFYSFEKHLKYLDMFVTYFISLEIIL